MIAEFIYRPISGQFPEKHFGFITPHSLWVKFIDKDNQEWVGSFSQGWEGYATSIINFENEEKTFVVSGGQGYLIDTTRRDQLNKIVLSGIQTAIADPNHRRVIFSSGYDLQCIDFDGKSSTLFDKNFFDDIELMEIRDNKLSARYWYYQRDKDPFHFEIDLETNHTKDTYQLADITNLSNNPTLTIIQKISKWFNGK